MLLSCSVLLICASCGHKEEKIEEETRFTVTSPLRKDTTVSQEYVCQIRSIQHIELRALERGYLRDIYVDEGQFVKKGQLMFRIMPLMCRRNVNEHKPKPTLLRLNISIRKLSPTATLFRQMNWRW